MSLLELFVPSCALVLFHDVDFLAVLFLFIINILNVNYDLFLRLGQENARIFTFVLQGFVVIEVLGVLEAVFAFCQLGYAYV